MPVPGGEKGMGIKKNNGGKYSKIQGGKKDE